MAMERANYPYALGGLQNGRYWASLAQAQSSAVNSAYSTNVGALSNLALANAYQAPANTVEDAGIRAGEIVGYRAWKLGFDGLLRGMFIEDYVWRPQSIEHSPVVADTWGEGLHAFKTLDEAKSQYTSYAGPLSSVVFGEVALWGMVVEHEKGYRAEYAAITRLIVLYRWYKPERNARSWRFWRPKSYPKIEAVRGRYGLPRDGSLATTSNKAP